MESRTIPESSNGEPERDKGPEVGGSQSQPQKSFFACTIPYIYISAFSITGAAFREYCGRLFGADCEDGADAPHDFLEPLSSQICVTAGGKTEQHGGAFFRDLPANIFGSFIMGLLTPLDPDAGLKFPWLDIEHDFQEDADLHSAFSVGFCGSLTTFAAWNTQMIVMLDGSFTELGSQPVSAVFGYLIGLLAATSSFRWGRSLNSWLHMQHLRRRETDQSPFRQKLFEVSHTLISWCTSGTAGCLFAVLLVILFLVGYYRDDIPFYHEMLYVVLFSPFGALGRWQLAKLNVHTPFRRHAWFPFGTFLANILASVFSAGLVALTERDDLEIIVPGLVVGFTGNLSTVSTFVKELVLLSERFPGEMKSTLYCIVTILVAIALCLLVYMPIVRS